MPRYFVSKGDVLSTASDLLLLKYAQTFFGADRAVASKLLAAGVCRSSDIQPKSGHHVTVDTQGVIAPRYVMFLGTPPLHDFMYDQMQDFARQAARLIDETGLGIETVTTTVHGTGYGLDGGESLQRLMAGFQEGFSSRGGSFVKEVRFLTLDTRELRMLSSVLDTISPALRETPPSQLGAGRVQPKSPVPVYNAPAPKTSGASAPPRTPERKPHVFVAMPFSEDFQNVYEYGIYPAVRNCGLICERVDEVHFTGDILERIQKGIATADIVIADLTEARPNVYLEVGYAWGRGTPVIFIAKKGEKLHFDVSTHKCIFYGKYSVLVHDLEELIKGIVESGLA